MSGNLMTRPLRQLTTLRKPFEDLWYDFQKMAAEAFPVIANGPEICFAPSVDMSETDKAIEVRLDLPGMNAQDIEVRVNQNVLTVSGERKEEKDEKGKTFYRMERFAGRFSRAITLPSTVAEDEVVADYKEGVLTVTLPKVEAVKARKITVKT